jgi:hypothetical protein
MKIKRNLVSQARTACALLRPLAGQCNAQLLGRVTDSSSLPSLQCRGPILEAQRGKLPVRGLHFDSTTAALPTLTTINKRLTFLGT